MLHSLKRRCSFASDIAKMETPINLRTNDSTKKKQSYMDIFQLLSFRLLSSCDLNSFSLLGTIVVSTFVSKHPVHQMRH